MNMNNEGFIAFLFDSCKIITDDNLAKNIRKTDDELSEDELDYVVAATKPSYQRFLNSLNEKSK